MCRIIFLNLLIFVLIRPFSESVRIRIRNTNPLPQYCYRLRKFVALPICQLATVNHSVLLGHRHQMSECTKCSTKHVVIKINCVVEGAQQHPGGLPARHQLPPPRPQPSPTPQGEEYPFFICSGGNYPCCGSEYITGTFLSVSGIFCNSDPGPRFTVENV